MRLFLSLLLFSPAFLMAAEPFGLVLHKKGEVYVTRGIMDFEVQIEEVLMWEDEIETGEDGSIQITFDSSFLSIGPNTLVSFEKNINEDGEEIYLMILEEGTFRSKILNLGSRQFFEVETEGGVLRVHGTDFVTSYDPENGNAFNVSVLQGQVSISGPESEEDSEGDVDSEESQDSSSSGSAEVAPTMLSQNQSGGYSGEGAAVPVADMSYADADELKEQLPIPGDAQELLVIDDLGLDNLDLSTFVEEVRESRADSGAEESVSVADEIQLVQSSSVVLGIELNIDP